MNEFPRNFYHGRQTLLIPQEDVTWAAQGKGGSNFKTRFFAQSLLRKKKYKKLKRSKKEKYDSTDCKIRRSFLSF
jgi:hypothetical protein